MVIQKKRYLLLFSVMVMIFISLSSVSAIGCDASGWKGFGKLNENKSVCVTCPTCDYINISTLTPNGTILFQNEPMTESNNEFCYGFNGSQNNQLGTYEINGFSQLDEPLGLCYDVTFSGKENNIGAYVISLIIIIGMLLGVIWIHRKYNAKERERLYKILVLGFVKTSTTSTKSNLATMILYTIAYGILKMMFVLYYMIIMLFLFLFKDFVVSFGINTFTSLAPALIKISLYGLTIVGFVFMAQMYEVIKMVIVDVREQMWGVGE